jgi:hypothetical protein
LKKLNQIAVLSPENNKAGRSYDKLGLIFYKIKVLGKQ